MTTDIPHHFDNNFPISFDDIFSVYYRQPTILIIHLQSSTTHLVTFDTDWMALLVV